MSRPPFSFMEEADRTRPRHLHLWLSGCLQGSAQEVAELSRLAALLSQGKHDVVIVYSAELGLVPDGAGSWAAFIDRLPSSLQFVYKSSQLSMVMGDYDDDFVQRHPNHVHLDPYTDA